MTRASASLGGRQPAFAIVFASHEYTGLESMAERLAAALPGVPFVGGTSSGCVFDSTSFGASGVSVSLVAGDDLRATTRAVEPESSDLIEVASAAGELRSLADEHARSGRSELMCLSFAPSRTIIGDVLVAALKKGATAHAQLVGGLTAADRGASGGLVWSEAGVSASAVVIAGLFSERAVGIAVRHGWTPIGAAHRATRVEGSRLLEIDGRPAIEPWLEEVRAHGGLPPNDGSLALYLASHYELAILGTESGPADDGEPVVRGSRQIHADGSVDLFGSVPEGAVVRLVAATEASMFAAATLAAERALAAVEGQACGALGIMCVGRQAVLGDRYRREPELVGKALGVPFGGTTVNGEIALGRRAANGFYNSSAVIVAFPR